MGCSPSAIVAPIRVYTFEKNSIYIDSFYLSNPVKLLYKRFMDDNISLGPDLASAQQVCKLIADQDPDTRIRWEIDFQEEDNYVAFLDTQVKINPDGTIASRYYRKPQDKGIILNAKSHHPQNTKLEVLKNFYKTVVEVSSGREELQHSLDIVDNLAATNGYKDSRAVFDNTTGRKKRRGKPEQTYKAPLLLPYISEPVSNKIRNYIKQQKLDIRPIFKPGRTLSQKFCRSRPLDTKLCELGNPNNCNICPLITNGNCSMRALIYRIHCLICTFKQDYDGETDRPCHYRFNEHRRAARNPLSYSDNALGKHYLYCHNNTEPKIEFQILDRQTDVVRRKISEALHIFNNKPTMNDRIEMSESRKFMIRNV